MPTKVGIQCNGMDWTPAPPDVRRTRLTCGGFAGGTAVVEQKIKLIVGLGNPGPNYAGTRHNIGVEVVQKLSLSGFDGVEFYKPQSPFFMNETGQPVARIVRYRGWNPEQILVICDDFSISLGQLRLRLKGSSGGHNGLNSIINVLGTPTIPRLRVGIGPVPEGMDPADFVLKPFSRAEQATVEAVIEKAALAARCVVTEGFEKAMMMFNQKEGEKP
jgi:PTH1 family peptidyl-tRNA hydrolase